jgi:prolyl 4-hydroxylase
MITVLVYLNDVPTDAGGGTYFVDRDVRVPPQSGAALVFFPTLNDGRLNPHARHAAEELRAGTKHVMQVWYLHGDSFVGYAAAG